MKSKKSSSFKGLIFLLIILAIIGVFYILHFYKDNMQVNITYYNGKLPAEGVICGINEKTFQILSDGKKTEFMRVSQDEPIIIKTTEKNSSVRLDTILVTEERYNSGYINYDINLEKKEKK
jgi:hypothetical protein